jgi:protein-disulfide isomerase
MSSQKAGYFATACVQLAAALLCAGATIAFAADKPAAGDKPAAAPTPAAATTPDAKKPVWPEVLAKVGDETITRGDALDFIVTEVSRQAQAQPFDIMSQSVDQIIAGKLVDAEAAKAKKPTDEWLKEQVDKRIAEPSDGEVEAAYNQFKARLGDQTLEQAKPQIVRYLKSQQGQTIYTQIVDELRAKANIKLFFEPPRVVVGEGVYPSRGPKDAPVTIVEFSDYQCPFCSRGETAMTQVKETYGDKVRIFFRDFPLSFHQNAQKAAEAAGCAGDQGKFWEMHDKLFANQQALGIPELKKYAGELSLDQKKFDECLDGGKRADAIKKDTADGATAGVTGTPGFFVNGRFLNGAMPFEKFAVLIDEELRAKGIAVPAKPTAAQAAAKTAAPKADAKPEAAKPEAAKPEAAKPQAAKPEAK